MDWKIAIERNGKALGATISPLAGEKVFSWAYEGKPE